MATQNLQIVPTIKEGILYGLKNIPSLLVMVILYVLTVWIPYLNVGTTIGLQKAIIKIGRGEVINPLDIFNAENRKNLGDYFLLMGLMTMGITAAMAFMFIPGLVVGIAWGFAMYFFLDKGLSPTKCLKVSWKATDGEKWTIFWIVIVVSLLFGIVVGILSAISSAINVSFISVLFGILIVAVDLLMFAALVAIEGIMYKHFSDKADEIFADKIAAKAACGCPAPEAAPAAPAAARRTGPSRSWRPAAPG